MKLVFDPPYSASNEYSNIITRYLSEQGYTVYSLSEIFRSWNKFGSVKIIHLNWFETFGSYFGFLKKIIKLTILLLFRKKIVWTMHNKTPHTKKLNHLQRFLYYLLTQVSEKIVIHSKISEEIISTRYKVPTHKIVYIPHPNYINIYGELHETSQESFSKLRLLSFGAVRPYKNIELLINVANRFNDEIELHIAGNPESKEYKNEITNLAKDNKNITLELDFIDNDRIIALMSDYDLVVLPYDLRSSLNSGTIILCFSYAKTVIAPEIGTITDVDNKSYLITYKYESPEQHYDMLVEKISLAIKEKQKDTDVFLKWGNKMFAYVEQNNGVKDVQLKFIELYEGIL